ncbi:hypothetical protein Pmar_PMAR022056 [Perkinsus marinus ATCC 50983]|uniref:Uncharacterized protein n=1 Tax=Perkinsus marinus (strain ATCC 50983 / TXsc) TaxID=423536 RepID=C5L1K4_PERM5|nr:hypothetical protein Pmar_PMAR022056 [Perkinsus marinus ATCC 50983]EER09389.1 hypothetical protein Pmar_PMAR022056 [Perkinsus marinus ATCC 50983]|eukprot:XP_002777573.1 hypothetical protein Pmar_PMAR022056 [Perkinsus marinus ATCC 50983]
MSNSDDEDADPVVDEQLVVVHFRELAHSHFGKAVDPDTVRLVGMDKPGDGKLIVQANGEEVALDAMVAEPPGSFLIMEKEPVQQTNTADNAAEKTPEEPHAGYKVYGTTRGMIDVSVPRISAPVTHNTSDPLASTTRAPRGGLKAAKEGDRSSTIGGPL